MINAHKRRYADLISLAVMPFLTLGLLILSNFVMFGFRKPDGNWYWLLAINAVAMISFWYPAKLLSEQKEKESERTIEIEKEYLKQTQRVYSDNEISSLREWCADFTESYVNAYITKRLNWASVGRDEFDKKYSKSSISIITDKDLSLRQKKYVLSASKFHKIKPLQAEKLLPNLHTADEFNIIKDSYGRANLFLTARKLMSSVLMGFAIAMIALSTMPEKSSAVAVITALVIRLFTGCINFISGIRAGKQLIERNYTADLALKTERLNEFHARKLLNH